MRKGPVYRTTNVYDTLGRQTRIVYPDSADHADPENCTDCLRMDYDFAGRLTDRTDQRNQLTIFTYDHRGLLLTRTTDAGPDPDPRDTFDYDALGWMTLAQRGTAADPDEVSADVMAYTDLGNLDFEAQTIAGGTARTVSFNHDQAGNRIEMTYPAGEVLAYTPTAINQVDTITLDGSPFVDYDYDGRLLHSRTTTTDAPGADTTYEYEAGYDAHRRRNLIANRLQTPRGSETIAAYTFTHDDNGNPLTQTVSEAMPDFAADDRDFTVDRLNRLTATGYDETGTTEQSTFDLVSNREEHINRAEETVAYSLANPANEYDTIDGFVIGYDEAGNLTTDEDGRQYSYDEQNRLTRIKAADETVLANYTYDAIGRRILFEDPVAGVTTRYYYDGQSVIEERDGADQRVRYLLNGAQYIDERIAAYTDSTPKRQDGGAGVGVPHSLRSKGWGTDSGRKTDSGLRSDSTSQQRDGEFTYYLLNDNFSIAGTGNADGSIIERLDYSSGGDFAGGGSGPTPSEYYFDADGDGDIDLTDYADFHARRAQISFDT